MVSKFLKNKHVAAEKLTKSVPKAEELVEIVPPKAIRKIRKERPYRFFRYRGVAFISARRGDNAVISTWNEQTQTPSQGISVPQTKVTQAAKALAKILLAEQDLEDLGAKTQE